MAVYSEPVAIDNNSCNSMPTTQQDDGLQFIHTKLVSSQRGLCKLLAEKYGQENYKIEMRHNVYHIRVPSGCAALNLDEPEVRNILRRELSA